MLAHNVYFSLKDRSDSAVQTLVAACKKYLAKHPGGRLLRVRHAREGAEPPGQRPRLRHRAARHLREENKENWAKVRVFDSRVESV
jgi:hypothetical protein